MDFDRKSDLNNCEVCGGSPSNQIHLRSASSRIIWWNYQKIDRRMCVDCAERFYYAMQTRTLIQGWWGPLSALATVVFSVMNVFAIRSHRQALPYIQTPQGQLIRQKANVRKNPIAMALSVIALIVIISIANAYSKAPETLDSTIPDSYLNSCWSTSNDGKQLKHINCSDSSAEYIVDQVVSIETYCEDVYIKVGEKFACMKRNVSNS